MQVEQSIEIHRPADVVFSFLTDPAKLAEWQTSTVEVRRDAAGPLRTGERFREVHAGPFGRRLESTVEVAEYAPPRSFALRILAGPLPLDGRWTLEETPVGTRLHFHGEAKARGPLRFAGPLIARRFRADHQRLKQLVEREDPQATARGGRRQFGP